MEENEFIAPEWDDESWELYRSGYSLTGELKRERTRKLIECFPPMPPLHPDYDRERANYIEAHPWYSRVDYDSLSQETPEQTRKGIND